MYDIDVFVWRVVGWLVFTTMDRRRKEGDSGYPKINDVMTSCRLCWVFLFLLIFMTIPFCAVRSG